MRCIWATVVTQLGDAEVSGEDGQWLALFRCPQMVFYPKAGDIAIGS